MEGGTGGLDRRYTVPDHVAVRAFEGETVLLNLRTGTYHGLDEVGTRVLGELRASGDPRRAVDAVLAEWRADRAVVEADVAALCAELRSRDLLEPDDEL